jgi:phytoene desaturase
MTAERSVTVVGGGVAGLAAGVLLARRGVRVRLFEAADKTGGCCANTVEGGFTFHDGAVYLALPGMLDAAFARAGLDRARLVPLRRVASGYTAHLPDGSALTVVEGRVRLARPGMAHPIWSDGEVERFLARWRPMLRLFAEDLLLRPLSPWRLLSRGWRHLGKLRGTAGAELRRAFGDEAVQSGLGGSLLYTGAAPDELPVLSVVALASLLDEGFFLPVGGMGRIGEALQEALVAAGGELHLGARVTRIVVQRGRACGVDVAGRGRVESDAVLSTSSGMATFAGLLADGDVPGSMRRRVVRAPLSHTAVSVQLGLATGIDVPSHSNAVLPMLAEQERVFAERDPRRWINWSVPTAIAPELAPPGGSIVEMFCPLRRAAAAEEVEPERVADGAVEALSRFHRLDVAVRRVRGPDYFRDRMHLYHGALYGLSPAASPRAQFPRRTRIPGLYLAGQTTYPGSGVNPAMLSGVMAAERILSDAP